MEANIDMFASRVVGSYATDIAPLSHRRMVGLFTRGSSSHRKRRSHTVSRQDSLTAIYSVSHVKLATVFCFREGQEKTASSSEKQ